VTPEDAYEVLLNYAEPETADREGLADTPARAARAWAELTAGYRVHIPDLFTTFESNGFDEMVVVRDLWFYSSCEHHLEAIIGMAHIAYIPDGRIIGLSKLARLVDAYARRLQVQERMTAQIADSIMEHLRPQGTAVILSARHLCMERRGVQKPGAKTITSALRGVMFDKPDTRAEALALLRP
jgi:GTP cyclohydrolase I